MPKIVNFECDICGTVEEDMAVGHKWVEIPDMPRGDVVICPECATKIIEQVKCDTK